LNKTSAPAEFVSSTAAGGGFPRCSASRGGIGVPPEDPAALDDALERLTDDRPSLGGDGKGGGSARGLDWNADEAAG
jgi:hypothetical protein